MTDRPIVVVGAGMAGLVAAGRLTSLGHRVVVLDKGGAVGGRMATRTIGDARFDHGAQHFSVRSAGFAGVVEQWKADGLVVEWYRSPSLTRPERGVEPRHAGAGGMRRIPERLAEGLDVRTATTVRRIRVEDGRAVVEIVGSEPIRAAGVVVTPPLPQTLAILDWIEPDGHIASLEGTGYNATLAVMATLDGPSGLADGHAAPGAGIVAWIADNHHKGVSAVPAVTIHSTPSFAARHLESPVERWVDALVSATGEFLGAGVVHAVGHRWRYAEPRRIANVGHVEVFDDPPIVLAGEAFAGARVEGAYLSGISAGRFLAGLPGLRA